MAKIFVNFSIHSTILKASTCQVMRIICDSLFRYFDFFSDNQLLQKKAMYSKGGNREIDNLRRVYKLK